jgi:hypothetical protein
VRDKLLRQSGIDPKTIETEYWDAKARLLGAELAGEQFDKVAATRRGFPSFPALAYRDV